MAMPNEPPQRNLMVAGRMLLSVHFLTELYDKLTRFAYWVEVCEASGQPYPVAEMMLVTVLLLFGAPLLLVRGEHWRAALCMDAYHARTHAHCTARHDTHGRAYTVPDGRQTESANQ